MDDLKRYNLVHGEPEYRAQMLVRPDGNWVRHADHVAGVTRLAARLKEAEEADDFALLVAEARVEAGKAMRKFPQPNYVISKIAEEAGEVVKAAIHCAEGRETAENLRGEMKQTIAMLYRLWVEGDGVHGLQSVRTLLTRLQEPTP